MYGWIDRHSSRWLKRGAFCRFFFVKKPKINKSRKNTIKISIWKFLDKPNSESDTLIYRQKKGTIPNLTGIYFMSKKEALLWKEELTKTRKMWECSLF